MNRFLMINKIEYPITIENVIALDKDSYLFVLDLKDFIELIGGQYSKWFNNNDDKYVRCVEVSSKFEIEDIKEDILSGEWKAHLNFKINVLKNDEINTVNYFKEVSKLIINQEAEISLLEGFRLFLALEAAFRINPKIPIKVSIILSNYDIYELHESFSQLCMEN